MTTEIMAAQAYLEVAADIGAETTGSEISFAKLAETFGIHGERVEDPQSVEAALKHAMEQNGPALVDVVISQNTRKD